MFASLLARVSELERRLELLLARIVALEYEVRHLRQTLSEISLK